MRITTHRCRYLTLVAGAFTALVCTMSGTCHAEPPACAALTWDPPSNLEFLRTVPELKGISLSISESDFKELVKTRSLDVRVDRVTDHTSYWVSTPSGEHVVVMFRDGACTGIQRMAPTPATTKDATPPASADPQKKLYVVAPDSLAPALADFVRQKNASIPTTLISLEKVLADTQGADDPERLKRYFYNAWKADQLGYALLVGDVDVMPVRYMVLDRITPAAFDYSFYPSDLYYADLAKQDGRFDDWNSRKDDFHARYYGEVRGEKNKTDPINFDDIDYRADIAVGRWPVNTQDEVRTIAAKTLGYEKSILDKTHAGYRRATLFAIGGWVDSRDLLERVSSQLPWGWSADRRYYDTPTPPPDEKQLVELLNKGTSLVFHAGHGSDNTWEGCLSVGTIDSLKNADRLPIMISAGCSTAAFAPLGPYQAYVDVDGKEHKGTDHGEVFAAPPPPAAPYQRGAFNPSGLGEQLLKRGPNGAVAYIGCNTGSQPCGMTMMAGFVRTLNTLQNPRLGDCWNGAIAFYFEKENLAAIKPTKEWYPPSIFFQGMKFMLFGDPSLRLSSPGEKTAPPPPIPILTTATGTATP